MSFFLILISGLILTALAVMGKRLFLRGSSWMLPAFLILLVVLPIGVYLPGIEITFMPETAGSGGISVVKVLFFLWLSGFLFSILRLLNDLHSYARWKSEALPVPEAEILSMLQEVADRAGIRSLPELRVSGTLSAPVLGGWMHPCIYLPAHYQQWRAETLKMVLWHEVGHLTRLDLWKHLVSRFTGGFYWFNPLLRSLQATLTVQSELACDRWVIQQGVCRRAYLHALCDVARKGSIDDPRVSVALSMADRAHLSQRVKSLVEATPFTHGKAPLFFLLFLTILEASIVSLKTVTTGIPSEEVQLRLSAAPFPLD